MLPRRIFLANAACATVAGHNQAAPEPALPDLAAAKNIAFGTQITWADIAHDPAYADLVAHECAVVTPGLEAKWAATEPAENAFRFAPMDRVADFARAHGLKLHMHNLVWAVGMPPWLLHALAEGRGEAVLSRHIATVAGRYQDLTESWDVINEPADPRWPSAPEGLCTTPWRSALGSGFISLALQAAHHAAPRAQLLINDDDLEYDAPDREIKRTIYLRLVEQLIRRGVPLTGFGLEAHLKPWLPIAEKSYRRFLRELGQMGLRIYITELDVCDRTLAADIDERDRAVAGMTRGYLDLVLDEPAVRTVITWGLGDATSWMLRELSARRADGLRPRPLPYDDRLQPKPMRKAIAAAFCAAPIRPA